MGAQEGHRRHTHPLTDPNLAPDTVADDGSIIWRPRKSKAIEGVTAQTIEGPLLTAEATGQPSDTWAEWDSQYWAVLVAIRDRVLAVHPNAISVVKRPRNATIPLGDIEIARVLFATELLPKQGTVNATAKAYLCLGLGAGLSPSEMLRVTGSHVTTDPSGAVTVTVTETEHKPARDVPVLAPWAPMLTRLAADSVNRSLIKGRGNGKAAANRGHNIADIINRRDTSAVRADSTRLRATWLCVHLACGTPVPYLLTIAGISTAHAFDSVKAYVPRTSRNAHEPWQSTALILPTPTQRTAQQQVLANNVMTQRHTRRHPKQAT